MAYVICMYVIATITTTKKKKKKKKKSVTRIRQQQNYCFVCLLNTKVTSYEFQNLNLSQSKDR